MDILNWQSVQPSRSLAERLECGEIVTFAPCPFVLPGGDDRTFLGEQKPSGVTERIIKYDPATRTVTGFVEHGSEKSRQLTHLLSSCADSALLWLGQLLPNYTRHGRLDQLNLAVEEEATRKVSLRARNDLLHIDAFAARPTQGRRLLRLFVNLHLSEARVWATSEPIAGVLARFGERLKRHGDGPLLRALKGQWWNLMHPGEPPPSAYDEFMGRLERFLKDNDEFQEKARKKFHHFAPGTAWLAFTDGFCHAELRGQFALDLAFLIAPEDLALPEQAPIHLWQGKNPAAQVARAA